VIWLALQENVKQGNREMQEMRREPLKDMLASLPEKIVLDPASRECQIHLPLSRTVTYVTGTDHRDGVPTGTRSDISGISRGLFCVVGSVTPRGIASFMTGVRLPAETWLSAV
jgi:hypothetical protein